MGVKSTRRCSVHSSAWMTIRRWWWFYPRLPWRTRLSNESSQSWVHKMHLIACMFTHGFYTPFGIRVLLLCSVLPFYLISSSGYISGYRCVMLGSVCHHNKLFDYDETSVTDDPNNSANCSLRHFVVVVATRTCKPIVEPFLREAWLLLHSLRIFAAQAQSLYCANTHPPQEHTGDGSGVHFKATGYQVMTNAALYSIRMQTSGRHIELRVNSVITHIYYLGQLTWYNGFFQLSCHYIISVFPKRLT